ERLLAAIKKGASSETGLDSFKTDTILSGVDTLLKGGVDANGNLSSSEKGISKIEYLRIPNKLGQVAKSDGMNSTGMHKNEPLLLHKKLKEHYKGELVYSDVADITDII